MYLCQLYKAERMRKLRVMIAKIQSHSAHDIGRHCRRNKNVDLDGASSSMDKSNIRRRMRGKNQRLLSQQSWSSAVRHSRETQKTQCQRRKGENQDQGNEQV